MLQARADAAADAAALAAADQLTLGEGPAAATAAAAEVASANGARLVTCYCAGLSAEVLVSVSGTGPPGLPSRVGGRARAEADLIGWPRPGP